MKDRKHVHVDPLLPTSDWNISVISNAIYTSLSESKSSHTEHIKQISKTKSIRTFYLLICWASWLATLIIKVELIQKLLLWNIKSIDSNSYHEPSMLLYFAVTKSTRNNFSNVFPFFLTFLKWDNICNNVYRVFLVRIKKQ